MESASSIRAAVQVAFTEHGEVLIVEPKELVLPPSHGSLRVQPDAAASSSGTKPRDVDPWMDFLVAKGKAPDKPQQGRPAPPSEEIITKHVEAKHSAQVARRAPSAQAAQRLRRSQPP